MTPVCLAFQRVDPRLLLHEQFDKDAWDPVVWKGFIIIVAGILAFLVLLHFIFYYEKRAQEPKVVDCPRKLFSELLRQLNLSGPQREMLRKMARELQLESPATMLLSPGRLTEASQRWLGSRRRRRAEARHLQDIAATLFGDALPSVSGSPRSDTL